MKGIKAADVIASFLILLFAYTAASKFLTLHQFEAVLTRMPGIGRGADVVARAVPLLEVAIVLLLLFPATRLAGLYASLALLICFTIYLLASLLFAPHLPCGCGGVISSLGWREHIALNLLFAGLTTIGIRSEKRYRIQLTKNDIHVHLA